MNAQKERKTEYMREHFAVLRRKRMDQRDSSADILILRILSGAFAAHGCAPTTHGPMPEPTPGLTPEPVTITVPPATPPPITPAAPTAPPWYVSPTPSPTLTPVSNPIQLDAPRTIAERNGAKGAILTMIDNAASHLGAPYQSPPREAGTFDCASLVQVAARTIDSSFEGSSCRKQKINYEDENKNILWEYTSSNSTLEKDMKSMIPGDLIYWKGEGSAGHVAIYLGEGYILDATMSGNGVAYRQYIDYIAANPKATYTGYARFRGE